MPTDKLCLDNFRDVKKALVVQDPINIFPALLDELLIGLEFSGLLVFGLQLLQLQSHATNAGCIKTFILLFALEWVPKFLQLG